MQQSKVNLILHPVRMRIIRALAGGRHLTAQQISEGLSDVPQATLYRHINALLAGHVITVVKRNPVRGAVEKVYALLEHQGFLTPDEMKGATPEDHMEYFMAFVTTLIQDFDSYLQQDDIDFLRDGVGYRQIPLFLTDSEFQQMAGELNAILLRYYGKPEDGRIRRTLTTITIPEIRTAKQMKSDEEE